MVLHDKHVAQRHLLKRHKADVAVNAEGRERDAPIPAKIAMDLAQHIAMRNGVIVFGKGHRPGLGGGPFRCHPRVRGKADFDMVLARNKCCRHIAAIAAVLVIGGQNLPAIQPDLGAATVPPACCKAHSPESSSMFLLYIRFSEAISKTEARDASKLR